MHTRREHPAFTHFPLPSLLKLCSVQDPNCQNVAEWFEGFAAAGGLSGRGKSVKKRGEPKSDSSDTIQSSEVAARFSQATAELQFLGLIRPATRRKAEMVQRCVHMPALH